MHEQFPKAPPSLSYKDLYVLTDDDADSIKGLCIKHVPFWNNLTRGDIEVQSMKYSVTNRSYRVFTKLQDKNTTPITAVLVKRTSAFNSIIYDSDQHYKVAKLLGDNNCGPRVLCQDGEFIILEWIEGTALVRERFQSISTLTSVAVTLAKFHKKTTELVPKDWDRTPLVFTQLEKWSKELERIVNKHSLDFDVKELLGFAETYKKVITNHVKGSKSVCDSVLFCHNDLYPFNFLGVQQGVFLIDFDFCAFNYVGWDIATLFMKLMDVYGTGTYPYFEQDPAYILSDEMTSIFVSVYLSEFLGDNVMPSSKPVREFMDSLEVHYLGVYVFWVFWAIVMIDKPTDEVCKPLSAYGQALLRTTMFRARLKELMDKNRIHY